MNTQISYPNTACYRWLMGAGILLILLSMSSMSSARPMTATVTDLKGQVRLSRRSGSPVIGSTIKVGDALKTDDTIQTHDGAAATLTLSDGSVLQLGENTRIDIVALVLEPATGARESRLTLLEGRIHATVSSEHQKEGSSFTVETPNAIAEVTFSRPVIEVMYDPKTETSVFKAYSVVLNITNRLTRKVNRVPRGSQAIIRRESTMLSPISSKIAPTRNNIIQQSRSAVRGATSTTVPLSVGAVGTNETDTTDETVETRGTTTTETSTNPSPGTRPEAENRTRPRPVTITIRAQ